MRFRSRARCRSQARRRLAALAGALVALGLALSIARPSGPSGMRVRDFEAYYAAGASVKAGVDPYGRGIWRAERDIPGVMSGRDELLPYVGPPFALPLWSALARLPYGSASALWTAAVALAALGFVLAALRLAGGKTPLDICAALALGGAFAPLTSGIALGQVAIVSCAGTAGALLALEAAAVAPAFASALVAALQPNLAIVLAARLGSLRAALALGGAACAALLLSAVAARDFGGLASYLATLRAHAAAERFAAIQLTPVAILNSFGLPERSALVTGSALALAVVLVVALQCGSRRYGPLERGALACAALPLAFPFAHEHDLALVLLPAILCARRATGLALPLAAFGTVLAATDWLGLAERDATFASALGAVAAACALAALRPAPVRAQFAAASVALGVLWAGGVAAAHRIPVWPDALASGFRADGTLDVAAVWHLEQQLAGIERADPYLGLLRLLSLAGCAMLWAAVTSLARRSEPSSTPLRLRAASGPSC